MDDQQWSNPRAGTLELSGTDGSIKIIYEPETDDWPFVLVRPGCSAMRSSCLNYLKFQGEDYRRSLAEIGALAPPEGG